MKTDGFSTNWGGAGTRRWRACLRMGFQKYVGSSGLGAAVAGDAPATEIPRAAEFDERDDHASHFNKRRQAHGFLEVDLLVGLAILTLAIVPLGYSFARERQVLKMEYARSVANEIVDGEMEILAAGAGKNLPDGPHNYSVHAQAAASLPPGHFQLTKTGKRLRLEWQPDEKRGISAVIREANLP